MTWILSALSYFTGRIPRAFPCDTPDVWIGDVPQSRALTLHGHIGSSNLREIVRHIDLLRQDAACRQPVRRFLKILHEGFIADAVHVELALHTAERSADFVAVMTLLLGDCLGFERVVRCPFRFLSVCGVNCFNQIGVVLGELARSHIGIEIDLEIEVPPFEKDVVAL